MLFFGAPITTSMSDLQASILPTVLYVLLTLKFHSCTFARSLSFDVFQNFQLPQIVV